MLCAMVTKGELMIVLIFHGVVIIVIHKLNVFNYIVKQEDLDQHLHLQMLL